MKTEDMNEILHLLADANPKSVFLEIAFAESWLQAAQKRHCGSVPLAMIERSLPFFEEQFRFRPRLDQEAIRTPSWAHAAAFMAMGLLATGLVGH